MKNTLLLLFLSLFLFSCFDKEDAPAVLPSGTYTGTFQRSSPIADYPRANVTLVFDGNSFSGSSDHLKYPAIGQGTYQVNGQEVTFKNASFMTAEFDWTLILDGAFALSTNQEGGITLTRKTGEVTDVYHLVRQSETN
ncbi:hypothetical protein [Rufibacter latericius]|uniref:Lipocalin-like domain-containing protein n=1 Tax=Rufibacter latericius TaxID=2487040 RepID=A0A3M9MLP5_9BACT|nr:hypothetical protein [Rufibacter latericius]RNI25803.1 hypothetical protein EFB08_13215 [Rufibacter latericius]